METPGSLFVKVIRQLNTVKGILTERLNEIEDDWNNATFRNKKLNPPMEYCINSLKTCINKI